MGKFSFPRLIVVPLSIHFSLYSRCCSFLLKAVKGNARESEVNASSVKQKRSWNWRSVAYEIQERFMMVLQREEILEMLHHHQTSFRISAGCYTMAFKIS